MTKLKTILVSEATNIQLDWLVAKAQEAIELEDEDGKYWVVGNKFLSYRHGYHPSEAWINGGPIIEREGIELLCNLTATEAARFACGAHADWQAFYRNSRRTEERSFATTPLIAAMRAFVCSRLGETVEIPEELL